MVNSFNESNRMLYHIKLKNSKRLSVTVIIICVLNLYIYVYIGIAQKKNFLTII